LLINDSETERHPKEGEVVIKSTILQLCLSPSWGGLEMVAFETAERLDRKGLSCITGVPSQSALHKKLNSKALKFLTLKPSRFFNFTNVSRIRKYLEAQPVDVIVVQQLHDLWYLLFALRGFPNVKVVGFSHTFVGIDKKDIFHRWLYQRLDTLICLTESHRENLLQRLPISEKQLRVIPNSVCTFKFNPRHHSESVRKVFDRAGDKFLIGLVGRLDEGKGQKTLLEAALILRGMGIENFKILLIGEDTLNDQGTGQVLHTFVAEKGLADIVTFTGFRSDVPAVIASLDILVMASDAETFGRVVIEGMASGVPVIATGAGGIVDIIEHGKTGLLVPPRSPEAMADALKYLMSSKEKRQLLAAAALSKVQNVYSEEVVLPQIDAVLGLK